MKYKKDIYSLFIFTIVFFKAKAYLNDFSLH